MHRDSTAIGKNSQVLIGFTLPSPSLIQCTYCMFFSSHAFVMLNCMTDLLLSHVTPPNSLLSNSCVKRLRSSSHPFITKRIQLCVQRQIKIEGNGLFWQARDRFGLLLVACNCRYQQAVQSHRSGCVGRSSWCGRCNGQCWRCIPGGHLSIQFHTESLLYIIQLLCDVNQHTIRRA